MSRRETFLAGEICLWKGIKEVNFPTISVWGKQGEEPDYTQTQSSNKRHYKV